MERACRHDQALVGALQWRAATNIRLIEQAQVLPVVKIQWEADQTANAVDSGIDIPCLATLKVTLTLLSRNKGQRAVIQKDINNKNKMCELIKLDVIKITSSEPSMLIKYPTAALLKTRLFPLPTL